MRYPFLVRHENSPIWRASNTIWGLTSAWNHATNPALPMTDWEHHRARQYASVIKGRIARLGYTYGHDYIELSNGMLWPKRRQWHVSSDETPV